MMYFDVSHPHSLVQCSWDFRHVQVVGIGSSDMSVGCKLFRLVAIPGQQVKVILVYRHVHYAKSSPGKETFLHGMTMYHLWVANFLAFLSWIK